MQTKHLCVLTSDIWTKGEVGTPWNRFEPSSKIVCFFCGADMLFLSCFCYAFVRVCLLMLCCHLLGKGCPLGSRLWSLIVNLSLSHWYPGSGVVLDFIDSWSLPSFLLLTIFHSFQSFDVFSLDRNLFSILKILALDAKKVDVLGRPCRLKRSTAKSILRLISTSGDTLRTISTPGVIVFQ